MAYPLRDTVRLATSLPEKKKQTNKQTNTFSPPRPGKGQIPHLQRKALQVNSALTGVGGVSFDLIGAHNGLIFHMGEVSELWRKTMASISRVFNLSNCSVLFKM